MGLGDQLCSDIVAGQHGRGGTQLFSQLQHRQDAVTPGYAQALQAGCFHVGGGPLHVQLSRQASGSANGLFSAFMLANADQHRTRGVPNRHGIVGVLNPVVPHIVLHPFSGTAQGDFAQRDQVAFAEEVLCRTLGLLWQVDLARLEAGDQLVGRHVHQNDFVGPVQ